MSGICVKVSTACNPACFPMSILIIVGSGGKEIPFVLIAKYDTSSFAIYGIVPKQLFLVTNDI